MLDSDALIFDDEVTAMANIFVFGSNKLGIHGAGAAKIAHCDFGAVYGVGEGLRGTSYAIPTKKTPYVALPIEDVRAAVERFIAFAREHPELEFQLTRIGCGLAGFTDAEIAPLFRDIPANVHAPETWRSWLLHEVR